MLQACSGCLSVGSCINGKESSLIPTLRSENLANVSTEYFSLLFFNSNFAYVDTIIATMLTCMYPNTTNIMLYIARQNTKKKMNLNVNE